MRTNAEPGLAAFVCATSAKFNALVYGLALIAQRKTWQQCSLHQKALPPFSGFLARHCTEKHIMKATSFTSLAAVKTLNNGWIEMEPRSVLLKPAFADVQL
jgi:hypothetical protein